MYGTRCDVGMHTGGVCGFLKKGIDVLFSIATFFREVFSEEPIFRIGIAILSIPAILENVNESPESVCISVHADEYGGFR
jgi:hypothetical protein